jgi:hypothetical protein
MGRGLSPINETTPGFSAAPGEYNAAHVTVPLGPYQISFSTRLENVTYKGEYEALGHNETTGSGKDYHVATYDECDLYVLPNETGYIHFRIYRYVGPSLYPPVDPDPNGYRTISGWIDTPTMSRDDSGPEPQTIDGKPGTVVTWWSIHHNINVVYPSDSFDVQGEENYFAAYQPNDKTFVVVEFYDIDYDKDVALVLQTLHISS